MVNVVAMVKYCIRIMLNSVSVNEQNDVNVLSLVEVSIFWEI